jgi:hypothetical protein
VTTENFERQKIIDFTAPLEVTQTSILTSISLRTNFGFDVIQHFGDTDLTTWLLLFIFTLVTSAIIDNNFEIKKVSDYVSNILWNSWIIITLQKFDYKLMPLKLRIALTLTRICISFIVYYFMATISSEVILQNTSETIDSLEDLISNQNMRPAFFEGTAHEGWFLNHKSQLNELILSKSIHFKGDKMFSDEVFVPLIENKIAIIAGSENLESISIKACTKYSFSKFYIASKTFNNNRNCYAIRKEINSNFRKTFDKK